MDPATEADRQWHRISPLSVIFFLLTAARRLGTDGFPAVLGVLAWYASADAALKENLLRGLLALLAVGIAGAILSWLRFRFRVTDERVELRRGVLHREELNIDFDRVQNINIKEPFYMRPLGLAVLSIDTAGSHKKEIQLAGVEESSARVLRETILDSARRTAEVKATTREAEEAADSLEDGRLLVERNTRDIMIYGLTANFLLWVALAIGAFFGTGDVADKIMGWVVNTKEVTEVVAFLERYGGALLVGLAALAAMLLVLMFLPILSVIGALFRYHDYRLKVDGETYRRTAGLLTRHAESLKRHKIQAVVWKQNFVARLFRRLNMQLRQASAGTGLESGQIPTGPKANFIVPALHPEEAYSLTEEFLEQCDPSAVCYSQVDRRRFMLFNLGLTWLPITALVLGVPAIWVDWKFAMLSLPVLGLGWLITARRWNKLGYGVVGEYGFARHGLIGSETTIFPLFKVQRVDIRQTPLQHRSDLSHLTIHLASHSLTIPYVPIKEAFRFRDLALFHVESTTRAWY